MWKMISQIATGIFYLALSPVLRFGINKALPILSSSHNKEIDSYLSERRAGLLPIRGDGRSALQAKYDLCGVQHRLRGAVLLGGVVLDSLDPASPVQAG
jgi:hypothetical protein